MTSGTLMSQRNPKMRRGSGNVPTDDGVSIRKFQHIMILEKDSALLARPSFGQRSVSSRIELAVVA
ncbi:MAG: hypothetical protein A07HR60_01771 [uncultured archaeon A07HR60]|nr:MAG: hypothetical protein A07HR60_01771 [uncultured archaeon A07HR60]